MQGTRVENYSNKLTELIIIDSIVVQTFVSNLVRMCSVHVLCTV